jgi:Flp pilus assembly protein TadG
MISPAQWIHGVEWVWLVWAVAAAVVLRMTWHMLRRWRQPRWAELVRGEEGVSYTLSYVLVLPLYLLFVCVVFEASWLLMGKIGTLYAAHAGARSQVVWASAQPSNLATTRTNQSVWSAMAPFVSAEPRWRFVPLEATLQAAEYTAAYRSNLTPNHPNANVPDSTLGARYLWAASRTSWQAQFDTPRKGDVTVTVTYDAPLHIPGAARIFSSGRDFTIRSSATLPSEAPVSADGTLGIEYQSR